MLVVGAPLVRLNRLYNCAVVIHRGQVLGVVPKSYLPTYREFYERRWFAPGDDVTGEIRVAGQDVPFGPDLLFAADDLPGFVLHAEICEDIWVPIPPSPRPRWPAPPCSPTSPAARSPSAKAEDRKLLCASGSSRLLAAYVYAAAGEGESTTDLSWDGQTLIYEGGDAARRDRAVPARPAASHRRRRPRARCGRTGCARAPSTTTAAPTPTGVGEFRTGAPSSSTRRPATSACAGRSTASRSCPTTPARLAQDCYEAFNIQVAGWSSGCARSASRRS